ncbi:MAG: hypothetical protein AAFU80_13055 [Pseudomonadota bacterium]
MHHSPASGPMPTARATPFSGPRTRARLTPRPPSGRKADTSRTASGGLRLEPDWTIALRSIRDAPPAPPSAGQKASRRIALAVAIASLLVAATAAAAILPDPMRARLAADTMRACASGPGLFLPPRSQDPLDQITRLEHNESQIDQCATARRALALHDAGICAALVHGRP